MNIFLHCVVLICLFYWIHTAGNAVARLPNTREQPKLDSNTYIQLIHVTPEYAIPHLSTRCRH